MLDQIGQRGSGWPIPGRIEGQVAWSSKQPDVGEKFPCSLQGMLDLLTFEGPL